MVSDAIIDAWLAIPPCNDKEYGECPLACPYYMDCWGLELQDEDEYDEEEGELW